MTTPDLLASIDETRAKRLRAMKRNAVGLLVLAAIGAGRFAGLDFLLKSLRMRWFPPKTENN